MQTAEFRGARGVAAGIARSDLVTEPLQVPAVDPGDEAAAEKGDTKRLVH